MRHSVGPGQVSTARKDAQEHGGSYPDRVSCYDSAHESHLHINDAPVLDPLYRILNYRKVNEVLVVGMECIPLPKHCPYCKSTKLTKWGKRDQNICDIPRHGHPVRLQIETKRFRCREESCSKTFSQDLHSIAEGRTMTKRLMRWIGEQGVEVRKIVGVRIARMQSGLFGDVASVGDRVSEARIHVGPGYRLYCQGNLRR